jgi:hypothetical protein
MKLEVSLSYKTSYLKEDFNSKEFSRSMFRVCDAAPLFLQWPLIQLSLTAWARGTGL